MSDITLLSGGLGQELVHRAGDKPTPLWSTQIMIDHPGLVKEVHLDYLAAGARTVTTNTYAIHRDRLLQADLEASFDDLHRCALAEAKAAVSDFGAGRIAGSIGPLRQSYRPDLHPVPDTAVPLFTEVARMIAPEVDWLIFETVASVDHACDALTAGRATDLPVWIALTVSDHDGTTLRSGEPLEAAVQAVSGAEAILVNCSAPEAVTAAMPLLAQAGKPFGGYANGFVQITEDFLAEKPTVDTLEARRDMGPRAYAGYVMEWVAAGATIVGGCCEVGPAHITELHSRLTAAGHTIV